MAIAKRSIFVLLILTINRQGFVSDALPNPRMMWISMQAALETQDRTLFQDQDLEKNSDFPISSTSELPSDSTTTDSTSELPTDSTTTDSTTSSTTTTTEAVELIYKLYHVASHFMTLGKNFSSISVSSFEECKEVAAEGEFGSFTYEEGQCNVSTFWRSDFHITRILIPSFEDRFDVYFLVRDDGTDCYTPNMTLISQGEAMILGNNVLEEFKAIDPKRSACMWWKFECKDNGTLETSPAPEVDGFTYFETVGRCARSTGVDSVDIKEARRECSNRFSSLYIPRSEEESSAFIAWHKAGGGKSDLIVDFVYDDSSSMFKWNGTDITISPKEWSPYYPVDPEKNRCGAIVYSGMKNVACVNIKFIYCVGIDIKQPSVQH